MSWHEVVDRILRADSGDLNLLADLTGANNPRFFRGINLSGVDIRGQDLTKFDLTGCDLSGANIDAKTLIDPRFDPRNQADTVRKSVSISRNLYICIRVFESDYGYVYTGWALKKLLDFSQYFAHVPGRAASWLSWLSENENALRLIAGGSHRYTLKLNSYQYETLANIYRPAGGVSRAIRLALIAGMFEYWNADPSEVGSDVLGFLNRVKKRPDAEATLRSLSKTWAPYSSRRP